MDGGLVMNMRELKIENLQEELNTIINDKKECFVYCVPNGNYVFRDRKSELNETYCKEHGITIIDAHSMGGAIVMSKGDIEVGIFRHNGWGDLNKFGEALASYLATKIDNVKFVDNDIIVDDIYKCAGAYSVNLTGRMEDNFILSACHISINMNLELIKNVCTKPMTKTPKGLSDYGITTEEIIKFIEVLEPSIKED